MAQQNQQPNLKEIRALGSEIIATDRQTDTFRFHELC